MEVLLELTWSKSAWEESLIQASAMLHVGVVTALLRNRSSVDASVFDTALSHAMSERHLGTIVALLSNVAGRDQRRRHCLIEALRYAARSQQVRQECSC